MSSSEIKYAIYKNGFTTVSSKAFVNTTKAVHSFATCNNLRDCLFKSQGGYYKLKLDGTLTFACRTLNSLTYGELYLILKD